MLSCVPPPSFADAYRQNSSFLSLSSAALHESCSTRHRGTFPQGQPGTSGSDRGIAGRATTLPLQNNLRVLRELGCWNSERWHEALGAVMAVFISCSSWHDSHPKVTKAVLIGFRAAEVKEGFKPFGPGPHQTIF